MIFVAILLGLIQAGEWRTRNRAEKLISEMYGLRVGQTTLADAQGLMKRWNKERRTYGPECSKNRCDYSFEVDDPTLQLGWKVCPGSICLDVMGRLADLLHAHLPLARLDLQFEDGVLIKSYAWIETRVPKGAGPTSDEKDFVPYSSDNYELVANARQMFGDTNDPTAWPKFQGHFTAFKPTACEGCLSIEGAYTPDATWKEVETLLRFNLSCMTRWKPCTVEKDIAPTLWDYYSRMPHP
jgi:hypothetical protein